jgi:hypothetical protein
MLIVVHASSPKRPRRPLPASAVVGARAPPLSSLTRAHVSPLRNAPARGQFGGRERCPEATPASRRRAPLRNQSFWCARRRIPHAHVQSRRILHGRLWSNRGIPPRARSTVDPWAELTARLTARARVHSRWIWDPWLGCGIFFKEPLSSCGIASRSFHPKRTLQSGPNFCELALSTPDNITRGSFLVF